MDASICSLIFFGVDLIFNSRVLGEARQQWIDNSQKLKTNFARHGTYRVFDPQVAQSDLGWDAICSLRALR